MIDGTEEVGVSTILGWILRLERGLVTKDAMMLCLRLAEACELRRKRTRRLAIRNLKPTRARPVSSPWALISSQPVASLTNPQQVLPSAIVSVESQTLRDLVAGDNLAR
jgi:hypothetical protein